MEASRDQGQNIVETCTPFGFSLFCPCCASLHLPQAAFGCAPFLRKEKLPKRTLKRNNALLWKQIILLKFLFLRDFFSLSKEKKSQRKKEGKMTNAIELIDLSKTFGQDEVLKHVTRSFEAGKIHGVVGNNGSGKTVMFKCICGFLQPTSGKVFVQGKQIGKDVDFPQDLGLIIETPGFLPQLSGLRNLEILASLKRRIGLKEVAAVIRRVGLDPLSTKPVGKYSLGMRQRLGIAQAIMEDPSLLILDEPMNGLDKHGVAEMRALFQSLATDGRTILLASHNIADIDALCDTVCEMDAGVMTMIREERV